MRHIVGGEVNWEIGPKVEDAPKVEEEKSAD